MNDSPIDKALQVVRSEGGRAGAARSPNGRLNVANLIVWLSRSRIRFIGFVAMIVAASIVLTLAAVNIWGVGQRTHPADTRILALIAERFPFYRGWKLDDAETAKILKSVEVDYVISYLLDQSTPADDLGWLAVFTTAPLPLVTRGRAEVLIELAKKLAPFTNPDRARMIDWILTIGTIAATSVPDPSRPTDWNPGNGKELAPTIIDSQNFLATLNLFRILTHDERVALLALGSTELKACLAKQAEALLRTPLPPQVTAPGMRTTAPSVSAVPRRY